MPKAIQSNSVTPVTRKGLNRRNEGVRNLTEDERIRFVKFTEPNLGTATPKVTNASYPFMSKYHRWKEEAKVVVMDLINKAHLDILYFNDDKDLI